MQSRSDVGSTYKSMAAAISPRKAKSRFGITFLASASSDLDEGFEASLDDEADGDVASLLGLDRPSPRKALADRSGSRSLVGYTPDPSVEYDEITLNPPIRTSTPVYAQPRAYSSHARPARAHASLSDSGDSTPDLPPYSVSDTSQHHENLSLDQSYGPVTPTRPHISTATEITVDRWDPKVQEDMERRADDFYKLGLAGRCWDVWTQSFNWVKETTDQIDKVRSNLLLRQMLAKWREAYEYQLSLPGTADRHRRLQLQSRALQRWVDRLRAESLERKAEQWIDHKNETLVKGVWQRWRMDVVQRRTERWKREIAKKERHFQRSRNARSMSETLLVSSTQTPLGVI